MSYLYEIFIDIQTPKRRLQTTHLDRRNNYVNFTKIIKYFYPSTTFSNQRRMSSKKSQKNEIEFASKK